ncbi:polyprenyl synthetase family protein [Metabacillus sp. GX 13764]|uniref:polyprenyl synthetase family protein n=1 Tax=Metabacillus kandeliae TaxID=2900151 RepID=UPI001E383E2C|nr:farnesyl diphosphate synthase [Metabacillus kandeliae]MCD7033211.1 polyprenyl synthetase family protein [Metabacillus kandeliae]
MALELNDYLASRKAQIEEQLPLYLQKLHTTEDLKSAMLYSLQAGGKRLRPILLLATLHSFGKDESPGMAVGCAIEMIHTYSLIHDDLPCMDDDDLRRGKPTNHKVFGEAMAVLSGDGLLTQSFDLIASHPDQKVTPLMKIELIRELVKAAGAEGMVGGQAADMEAENQKLNLEELLYIHEHKTAKLLAYSVKAGGILAGADPLEMKKLEEFGFHLGIAFQIKDDILDIEGIEDQIGKPVGSDTANHKSTYPALLTLDGAKAKLAEQVEKGREVLAELSLENTMLEQLLELVAIRDY